MSPPSALRTPTDLHLRDLLLNDQQLKQAIAAIERDTRDTDTRRQLLATAVRLTPKLAPGIHRVVDGCRDKLNYTTDIELYVYADAQLNAAAARPEDGRSFVLFSSSLLEALSDDELSFVVGHELGHHIFSHHEIPVGALMRSGGGLRPAQVLQMFAWSRHAEISADRAGYYCCEDLEAVGTTLFKLASGLKRPLTDHVIEAMLAQYADIEGSGQASADDAPRADWVSTHPFSPLRIKAAQLFAQSEVMRPGGQTIDQLEIEVTRVMSVMEPGYLRENSDGAKAMRRFLLAGGMVLASSDGVIDDREIAAIDELLGAGTVTRQLDVDALRSDLPRRIADVVARVSVPRRAQVLRDLCLIARTDSNFEAKERALLDEWSQALGMSAGFVACAVECPLELD